MAIQQRANYINPLTMMKQTKNNQNLGIVSKKKTENKIDKKGSDLQKLQTEKQMAQNAMVLLKTTSNGGNVEQAQQEALTQKIEEISKEIRTTQSQEYKISQNNVESLSANNSRFDKYIKEGNQPVNNFTTANNMERRFDRYVKQEEQTADDFTGIYYLKKEENGKTNIIFQSPETNNLQYN